MNRLPILLIGGIAIGVAGCTLAPKYTRPEAPVPNQWPAGNATAQSQPAATAPAARNLAWREFITDAKLQKAVELALANNRDLRLAAQNVELARAIYGIQRNALLPAVTGSAGGSKQRASYELTEPGKPVVTESYNVSLGVLSWEIDFFGRLQSLKNEALEKYLASTHARRSAQSLLISGVANTYVALASDAEALALAKSTLVAQEKAYDLVHQQYEAGIATELDLRQSQIPLETARASVAQYTRQVAQDENALNLLLGTQLPAELKPTTLADIAACKEVSAGLPSEVLLNRPDVLQAEGALKAANANIGAARAAFFPSISLTGTVGSASGDLQNLVSPGTGTWSFAPRATMPIFDTRVWAAHRGSKVQREMTVTQYEKAIQSAFREVADALATSGTIGQQLAAQESLVEALTVTHKLANERFERGVDSYLVVLDAQRSLFSARQGLVSLRMAKIASQVRLYAALGGGGDDQPEQKK
ncbi:MAG: efflux transporter outer membrane subunit [Nibricoccus sp.]